MGAAREGIGLLVRPIRDLYHLQYVTDVFLACFEQNSFLYWTNVRD